MLTPWLELYTVINNCNESLDLYGKEKQKLRSHYNPHMLSLIKPKSERISLKIQ